MKKSSKIDTIHQILVQTPQHKNEICSKYHCKHRTTLHYDDFATFHKKGAKLRFFDFCANTALQIYKICQKKREVGQLVKIFFFAGNENIDPCAALERFCILFVHKKTLFSALTYTPKSGFS